MGTLETLHDPSCTSPLRSPSNRPRRYWTEHASISIGQELLTKHSSVQDRFWKSIDSFAPHGRPAVAMHVVASYVQVLPQASVNCPPSVASSADTVMDSDSPLQVLLVAAYVQVPDGHGDDTQPPETQVTMPLPVQGIPQPPQLAGSVCVSTHVPVAGQ